jgi:hypothetical protein
MSPTRPRGRTWRRAVLAALACAALTTTVHAKIVEEREPVLRLRWDGGWCRAHCASWHLAHAQHLARQSVRLLYNLRAGTAPLYLAAPSIPAFYAYRPATVWFGPIDGAPEFGPAPP